MKTKLLHSVCAMLIAAVMAAAGTAYGAAAPAAYRIVTLGDSLAVGYEPGMTEKSVPYGYSERFREQALFHGRASAANYGILGLRTEGLIRLLQGAEEGKTLKAADIQDFSMYADDRITAMADGVGAKTAALKKSLESANVVVITIGGNDFGDFVKQLQPMSNTDAEAALANDFITRLNKYTEEAENALRLTASLAPHARILLADQYLPLPKFFAPDLYDMLYDKAVVPLSGKVNELAAKLQGEGIDVLPVSIYGLFKGKEGSLTHMAISLDGSTPPDIHPTQAGYETIAQAFAKAMWGEYRKPAARATGVPFSVVVSGREWKTAIKPVLKNAVAYASAADLAKALGAELKWDAKKKTAVFKTKTRTVTLVADGKTQTMTVGAAKTKLAAPAFQQKVGKDNKPFVPLTAVAASLQYEAVYSSQLQTYFLNP
ncbi:SGNH/GDSL hydrolase family protein [Cohnella candidum]|uniref:SGNH/GDSL hydrolase family protein n=1 Tax=Cohnella candidum TaxID=2674991 RepID=UPI0013DDE39C|nr:SGNH/GDSL hydrolase family protein [Cohnella candidum]